jgi:hypothetical protein
MSVDALPTNRIIAQVLEYGFTIDASSSVDELVIFLDSAAALKHLRLDGLSETDKKVGEGGGGGPRGCLG